MKLDLQKRDIDPDTGIESQNSLLFQDSYLDDPENYAYFKVSKEARKNKVDLQNVSPELLKTSMRDDKIYAAKLGMRVNRVFVPHTIYHCLSSHISTKYSSNM